ncbi:zinc metalloproteinase nas-14-like [Ixodes scapularis]|uniref:zinc metalloproteinase nas-14-like n=1 Tax=Ixodes scapularis TaxID=6945 RepID=UPI001A9EB593|nr:zinc metalloproteinase nas-14-like [Ixodes scapularis]
MTWLCLCLCCFALQTVSARPFHSNQFFYDPNNTDLFEGDIMIRNKTEKKRFDTYAGVKDETLLWPEGKVFYKIDKGFDSDSDRKVILDAMELLQSKTCVKFIERTDEENYVLIAPRPGRCASFVGMQGEEQALALDLYRCPNVGQSVHELMHAIGFFHEHSRPDRDSYISIQWNNIEEDAKQSFELKTELIADTLGQPYDYESVMHYPQDAFSKSPPTPTLIPKSPDIDPATLGKGYLENFLTDTDVIKVNLLYGCAK